MTPQDVIDEVRNLVQDTETPYRYSNDLLLGFVNQAIKRCIPFRPDLFTVVENISTTPNTVDQALPTGAVRLMEIFQIVDGDAITEANRETLDQMYPGWRTEAAAEPLNWMRHPRTPTKFQLYPRPSSGIELVAEYVKVPENYGLADDIEELEDSYLTALVDCTVFLAESIDNEHVNSGRAKLFYDSFLAAMSAELGTRVLTDNEDAAVGRKQQAQ